MFGFRNTGQIFYLLSYVKELVFSGCKRRQGAFGHTRMKPIYRAVFLLSQENTATVLLSTANHISVRLATAFFKLD